MKRNLLCGLLLLGLLVSGCSSININNNTEAVETDAFIPYSATGKLALYTGWNDYALSCDNARLWDQVCEQNRSHIKHTATGFILPYGKYLSLRSLEFDKMKGSILDLKVHQWVIEVEVISIRNRDKKEFKDLLKKGEGWLINAGYADERRSYFLLKEWEEKTLDIMEEYGNGSLHTKEEMSSDNWVGFDVIIRPLGLEASLDYDLSFKD